MFLALVQELSNILLLVLELLTFHKFVILCKLTYGNDQFPHKCIFFFKYKYITKFKIHLEVTLF